MPYSPHSGLFWSSSQSTATVEKRGEWKIEEKGKETERTDVDKPLQAVRDAVKLRGELLAISAPTRGKTVSEKAKKRGKRATNQGATKAATVSLSEPCTVFLKVLELRFLTLGERKTAA
jgi:hypothetical protein